MRIKLEVPRTEIPAHDCTTSEPTNNYRSRHLEDAAMINLMAIDAKALVQRFVAWLSADRVGMLGKSWLARGQRIH